MAKIIIKISKGWEKVGIRKLGAKEKNIEAMEGTSINYFKDCKIIYTKLIKKNPSLFCNT